MNETNNIECKNNYTETEFFTEFAKDDDALKNCNHCPHFTYDNGMAGCDKFNKGR